jgi:hypothetical protein
LVLLRCQPISYAKHILDWLRDCRKEATCVPVVRELLTHYIHLIETLTHQTPPSQMNEELVSQITSTSDNLNAFFYLRELESTVYDALFKALDARLDAMATRLNLERVGRCEDLHSKGGGFYFTSSTLNAAGLQLGFEFEKGGCQDFFFGFTKMSDQPVQIEPQLKDMFRSKSGSTARWPAWAWFDDPYRYWGKDAFEGLRSGAFADQVEARLKELLEIFKQAMPGEATSESTLKSNE